MAARNQVIDLLFPILNAWDGEVNEPCSSSVSNRLAVNVFSSLIMDADKNF